VDAQRSLVKQVPPLVEMRCIPRSDPVLIARGELLA
jgi:hypothetical protein